jgi:hypothetical protein
LTRDASSSVNFGGDDDHGNGTTTQPLSGKTIVKASKTHAGTFVIPVHRLSYQGARSLMSDQFVVSCINGMLMRVG